MSLFTDTGAALAEDSADGGILLIGGEDLLDPVPLSRLGAPDGRLLLETGISPPVI
jgi:hypothetical protein